MISEAAFIEELRELRAFLRLRHEMREGLGGIGLAFLELGAADLGVSLKVAREIGAELCTGIVDRLDRTLLDLRHDLHATLPADISFTDRKKALREAYPFGEREYWPYKAWCKAQRAYLKPYDPNTPEPPLLREVMRQANPDITFPFSKDTARG